MMTDQEMRTILVTLAEISTTLKHVQQSIDSIQESIDRNTADITEINKWRAVFSDRETRRIGVISAFVAIIAGAAGALLTWVTRGGH